MKKIVIKWSLHGITLTEKVKKKDENKNYRDNENTDLIFSMAF